MTPRRLLRIVSLAAPLLLAGCTAITDFSRFGFDEGLDHGLAGTEAEARASSISPASSPSRSQTSPCTATTPAW